MSTSDIIEQLSKLQLEQNKLIAQLIKQTTKREHNPKGKPKLEIPEDAEEAKSERNKAIKIGDRITLLTNGVRSKKGDEARVTDIKGKTIKFVIIRNGHSTYRKLHNVQKLQ
jgi:hypothetical protein